jgi:hypothetical protein
VCPLPVPQALALMNERQLPMLQRPAHIEWMIAAVSKYVNTTRFLFSSLIIGSSLRRNPLGADPPQSVVHPAPNAGPLCGVLTVCPPCPLVAWQPVGPSPPGDAAALLGRRAGQTRECAPPAAVIHSAMATWI